MAARPRRFAALALVLALVVTACGGGGDDETDESVMLDPFGLEDSTTTVASGTGGEADPGDPTPTPPNSPPTGDGRGGGPSPTEPAPGGSGSGEPGQATPRADPEGPPGSFAGQLLRPNPDPRLTIELIVQDGAAPSQGTLDHLTAVVGQVSQKPLATDGRALTSQRQSWSSEQIRAAGDQFGGLSQGQGGNAVIRLLFLRGGFAESDGVLGVAVNGDTVAVFSDQVRSAASPLVGPGAIEAAVTVHEVGHLLGLVDLFLPTERSDPEHPGHSPNRDSVMYWAVESIAVADILAGGPPRDFDAADLADLDAIRTG